MSRRRNALPCAIEAERAHQMQFDLLTGLQRLMRIRKRHQCRTLIVQMNMILLAKVLDAVDTADHHPAIARADPQVLGADSHRLRSRRYGHIRQ
jgi:hypothetical protein